jgi:hypothetical protein
MESKIKRETTYKSMEEFREKFPPAKFDYPFETTKQTTENSTIPSRYMSNSDLKNLLDR